MTCLIGGCANEKIFARGWCCSHWKRWRRHGDPTAGATYRGELRDWLEAALLQETDECIDEWPYGLVDGYPNMSISGRATYLNRYVCERFNGPPPTPDYQAAHSCGQRVCLNYRHLRWATNAENQADRRLHGTDLRGEQCSWSVLDAERVREIRRRAADGEVQRRLAEEFNVSPMTVSFVVRRITWTHVE